MPDPQSAISDVSAPLRCASRRLWFFTIFFLVLTALLVAANLINRTHVAAWTADGYWVRMCRGGIELHWFPNDGYGHRLPGLHYGRMTVPLSWWPAHTPNPDGWCLYTPFWIPISISFVISMVLIARLITHAFLRRRRGLCRACGYDRQGLSLTALCPECGRGSSKNTNSRTIVSAAE